MDSVINRFAKSGNRKLGVVVSDTTFRLSVLRVKCHFRFLCYLLSSRNNFLFLFTFISVSFAYVIVGVRFLLGTSSSMA